MATYTANLVAFLSVDIYNPPFDSVEDIANQDVFKFGTMGDTAFEGYFEVCVLLSRIQIISVQRSLSFPIFLS